MSLAQVGWGVTGVAVAVLLAALGWGIAHPALKPAGAVVGARAPEIVVAALDGTTIKLTDLRGTPVVLNFWASWCPPCRQEAPVLQAAARRTSGQVAFVGVDIQDSNAGARAYEAEFRDPYPTGPAAFGGAADYGVDSPPETFFIDRSGTVLNYVIGPLDKSTLDRYLGMISG